MSDLKKYIKERKKRDKAFAKGFDDGYEQFKIGVVLRQAREEAGLTQEELARRLKTRKTAISRIENHGRGYQVVHLRTRCWSLRETLANQYCLIISFAEVSSIKKLAQSNCGMATAECRVTGE
jgi:HTH-type transcriptional regulator/antitoxin HipB